MKLLSAVIASVILCVSGALAAQRQKVPDTLWKKAYEEGVVWVIVSLDKRISGDSESGVKLLERELVGTHYRLITVRDTWTSMEVGIGALQVLDASSLVVAVSENLKLRVPRLEREIKPAPP